MDYQWYPGHMTKSIRQMQEDIRLIDLIIEIVDARIPMSSRNPDIEKLGQGKARIIILNKYDLADERETKKWEKVFTDEGLHPILSDARTNTIRKALLPVVREACKEKIERNKRRGIMNRPMRAMVCGIPNVGKSTLINSFVKRSAAKTGNKPGVTKGKQWIRVSGELELMDTPGLLWPKFEDQEIGKKIALIGSMNDQNLVPEELAEDLIARLTEHFPGRFSDRYCVDETKDVQAILENIAVRRGCLKKGGEADFEKTSRILLDDFRSGNLGRITLDFADEAGK
ncbi:MAG: ribosome biogenesis GTPase YlqF [Lachnospiraceae bacterium]|nr:ribosome biogenesis GTPase YlqF [Lachnospiraceae bacterium]